MAGQPAGGGWMCTSQGSENGDDRRDMVQANACIWGLEGGLGWWQVFALEESITATRKRTRK